MKRSDASPRLIPLQDYDSARRTAVTWLGDRYLLAQPVGRRPEDSSPFFNQPRQWYTASGQSRKVRH